MSSSQQLNNNAHTRKTLSAGSTMEGHDETHIVTKYKGHHNIWFNVGLSVRWFHLHVAPLRMKTVVTVVYMMCARELSPHKWIWSQKLNIWMHKITPQCFAWRISTYSSRKVASRVQKCTTLNCMQKMLRDVQHKWGHAWIKQCPVDLASLLYSVPVMLWWRMQVPCILSPCEIHLVGT